MTKTKAALVVLGCIGLFQACADPQKEVVESTVQEEVKTVVSIDSLIAQLEDSEDKKILVVAHRGDWRNAPENSLQAIQNCIEMGVDMVEIDVRETSDGVLVLMHDETIDRTTTGTGKVNEVSWDYLQTLRLRDGIGHSTPHKIPTLEEALLLCKGKILVNLDKSYSIFDKCFDVVEQTATQRQVVIKGAIPFEQVKKEFGQYLDQVYFMPIVRFAGPDPRALVDQYLDSMKPVAFEFTVPRDTMNLLAYFDDIRAQGSSVWVNSLWPQHNIAHDDEKAALNPAVYDWYIDHDIDIIQTDRPALLLEYLRERGYHN